MKNEEIKSFELKLVGAANMGTKKEKAHYELVVDVVQKKDVIATGTVTVVAVSDKQARFFVKQAVINEFGEGAGFRITAGLREEVLFSDEEIEQANTHGGKGAYKKETVNAENKVKETMIVKKTNFVKISLVGETVNRNELMKAVVAAAKMSNKIFISGDAKNPNHLAVLRKVASAQAQEVAKKKFGLEQYAAMPVYATAEEMPEAIRGKKQPLNGKVVYVQCCHLSHVGADTRALLMRDALRNRADFLVGDAPVEPIPEAPKPEQPKKVEPKKETAKVQLTDAQRREMVTKRLVELGRMVQEGKEVTAEINKFGSYAHLTLKMSEEEINALLQKGAAQVSQEAKEAQREELRKLGKELAENNKADEAEDFQNDYYAECGVEINDEINRVIGSGVLDEAEARACVQEGYDSVPPLTAEEKLTKIAQRQGVTDKVSSNVLVRFVLLNSSDTEEAANAVYDISGLFSSVKEIVELNGNLVISGVLVRDGKNHKISVSSKFQGSVLE